MVTDIISFIFSLFADSYEVKILNNIFTSLNVLISVETSSAIISVIKPYATFWVGLFSLLVYNSGSIMMLYFNKDKSLSYKERVRAIVKLLSFNVSSVVFSATSYIFNDYITSYIISTVNYILLTALEYATPASIHIINMFGGMLLPVIFGYICIKTIKYILYYLDKSDAILSVFVDISDEILFFITSISTGALVITSKSIATIMNKITKMFANSIYTLIDRYSANKDSGVLKILYTIKEFILNWGSYLTPSYISTIKASSEIFSVESELKQPKDKIRRLYILRVYNNILLSPEVDIRDKAKLWNLIKHENILTKEELNNPFNKNKYLLAIKKPLNVLHGGSAYSLGSTINVYARSENMKNNISKMVTSLSQV